MTEDILHTSLHTSQHKLLTYIILTMIGNINLLTSNESVDKLGDNCIQNFHLGRYIVGYTVGNLVLWRRVSGAVKRDFRTYIRRYTSPNENFEYGYPHSNALLTLSLQIDSENVLFAPISPATPAA